MAALAGTFFLSRHLTIWPRDHSKAYNASKRLLRTPTNIIHAE